MEQKFMDAIEYLTAYLGKSSSYSEARLEETSSSTFLMKNGLLEASSSSDYYGIGARFVIGKSAGFFSTNDLSRANLKALADESIRSTKKAQKNTEDLGFSEEKANIAKYALSEKEKIADKSPESKIELLKDMDISIKKNAPERYFSLHDDVTEKYFINSNSSKIYSKIPKISVYYNFSVVHNGKSSQRSWMYGASSGYEAMKKWNLPEIFSSEAAALMKNLLHGVAPPKGKVDVVCAPEVVSIMVHESGGHPYEADRMFGREAAQAGESFISPSMQGTRIGSSMVNIADDPTIPGSYGYYLYDDEGVKVGKRMMVKDGIINEFLENRSTAYALGIKSNGAARAVNYSVEPLVRMANTYFVPGKDKEEELISEVKNGIYMKNYMEWNIDDVRLNQKYVGAEAYLIKNGRIVSPVINPVIEIATPDLYASVNGVANNLEFHSGSCGKGEPMQAIPVWFGGPTIRLHNITVCPKRK